jgi:hypothetical protein
MQVANRAGPLSAALYLLHTAGTLKKMIRTRVDSPRAPRQRGVKAIEHANFGGAYASSAVLSMHGAVQWSRSTLKITNSLKILTSEIEPRESHDNKSPFGNLSSFVEGQKGNHFMRIRTHIFFF